ncbi:MAG: hypothetical protein ABUL46_01735 [Chitinophaga rupis]
MKNDVSKGSGNRLPENGSMDKPKGYRPAGKRNLFLNGLANIVLAIKRKTFFSYRRKKVHKDGSISETEIIYRNDD